MANLIRGLSENGGVVFCGVDSTDIVRKAEKLHSRTTATASPCVWQAAALRACSSPAPTVPAT